MCVCVCEFMLHCMRTSLYFNSAGHPPPATHSDDNVLTSTKDLIGSTPEDSTLTTHVHSHADSHSNLNLMGLALVLGFVFMLLIDQVGKHSHASSTAASMPGWCGGMYCRLEKVLQCSSCVSHRMLIRAAFLPSLVSIFNSFLEPFPLYLGLKRSP